MRRTVPIGLATLKLRKLRGGEGLSLFCLLEGLYRFRIKIAGNRQIVVVLEFMDGFLSFTVQFPIDFAFVEPQILELLLRLFRCVERGVVSG